MFQNGLEQMNHILL